MTRLVEQFCDEVGIPPTDAQLAAALGLPTATVGFLRLATMPVLSLDKPVSGHTDVTLGEMLPDPRIPTCDEVLCQEEEEEHERPQQVQQVLATLTRREAQVLTLRFGLCGKEAHEGYAHIGRELGISRERVRQLYSSALAKLRGSEGTTVAHPRGGHPA